MNADNPISNHRSAPLLGTNSAGAANDETHCREGRGLRGFASPPFDAERRSRSVPARARSVKTRTWHGRLAPPGGFSMLEFMVAMVILGIALAGFYPLAIQHSKQVKKLEDCNPQTGRYTGNNWTYGSDPLGQYPDQWYLNPSSDAWAQKLGAAALLSSGTTAATTPLPVYAYDSLLKTHMILADNSTGGYYSESESDWIAGPATGYLSTSRRHSAGTAGSAASGGYAKWTFMNVPPGWYVVEAAWPDPIAAPLPQKDAVDEAATSSACYAIYDYNAGGGQEQLWLGIRDQTVALNAANQTAYDLDLYGGVYWKPIKTIYVQQLSAGPNTVEVRLMSQAQGLDGVAAAGFTTADAVRLVPIGNAMTFTLTRSFGTTTVSAAATTTPLTKRPE